MATSNKKAPVRKSNTRYASSSKSSRPKSRTGSSSLARSSKSTIFTKRNGIIAAGMAAVAGLAFVAFSFASGAPKTPDYQYSFSKACIPTGTTTGSAGTPAPTDAEQLKAQQDCYDKSAEGLVYRVYKGVFNREPNAGEYAYWVQQLAGDRVQGTTFVSKMIASNGAVVPKTATDAQFVNGLYKNMLLRTDAGITADKKGTDYWAKKMQGAKKWSRAKVAYHFATTNEAKRANATTFVAYISAATPVVIKENAKEAQAARLVQMKKYATTAGTNATAAKRAENAAKSALGTAKASSSLEAIAANKATAAAEAAKARTAMRAAKTAAGKADRLKKRARSLAVYAKDIGADPVYGMAKINDVHKLTKAYSTNASKSASTAGKTLAQIDAAYAARRAKIAEEAAAAAAAAERANNSGAGNIPTGDPNKTPPPPPPGATVEQVDAIWKSHCNSKANFLSSEANLTGGIGKYAYIIDSSYTDDGKHRRSCTETPKGIRVTSCTRSYEANADRTQCVLITRANNTPASPYCKGKNVNKQYWDYHYKAVANAETNHAIKKRTAVCDARGNITYGQWSKYIPISYNTYKNNKPKYEDGIFK